MMGIVFGSLIGLIAITGGWIASVYNTIKTAINQWEGMMADLVVEYQRRFDLFNNLSRSVKAETKFEKETQTNIAKLRSGMQDLGKKKPTIQQIEKVEGLFAGMKLQFEAYPELKSSGAFRQLNRNIEETEDRISMGRGELNNIAEDYNTYIAMFPRNIICKLLSAKRLAYFKKGGEHVKVDAPKLAL